VTQIIGQSFTSNLGSRYDSGTGGSHDNVFGRGEKRPGGASSRERVVVQLIAEGHSNREIAAILSLSVKTIETHRAAAMRKLNATSVASLVRYAIRNKLVEP
jgi:DNA-binding NarL/FixJ family response regulator